MKLLGWFSTKNKVTQCYAASKNFSEGSTLVCVLSKYVTLLSELKLKTKLISGVIFTDTGMQTLNFHPEIFPTVFTQTFSCK